MSRLIVYDHFIAHGGAENVSLQLSRFLSNSRIEAAYVDKKLFSTELESGEIVDKGFRPGGAVLNTPRLLLYFLLCYKTPAVDSVLLSGIFSPLSLIRKQFAKVSVVYFHMFPTFLNWSVRELAKRRGVVLAAAYAVLIPVYRKLLQLAVSRADLVYCNSKITQAQFAQMGITADVIYPPVDTSGFEPVVTGQYFLSTARLEDSKRVKIIADVFAALPQHQIIFVGGGTLLEEMQKKYSANNNIRFTGWLNPDKVKDYYQQAKCLVYLPENEAFGIAPVEALAAGKSVIGVNEGGLIEIFDDQRLGILLSSPPNPVELQEAIVKVAGTKESEDTISFRMERAKHFDKMQFLSKMRLALDVSHEKPDVI